MLPAVPSSARTSADAVVTVGFEGSTPSPHTPRTVSYVAAYVDDDARFYVSSGGSVRTSSPSFHFHCRQSIPRIFFLAVVRFVDFHPLDIVVHLVLSGVENREHRGVEVVAASCDPDVNH
jgi:hypothetical protein